MKRVLVIIVNYNGFQYLSDCLNSLVNSQDSDLYDILFVDNNSTDQSLNYVKNNYSQISILALQNNLGFAGGNNQGMEWGMAQGYEFFFLLNQDTIVTDRWLSPLLELVDNNQNIAAVQPKILLHPETTKINSAGNIIHYLGFGYSYGNGFADELKYQEQQPVNYCSGAAVLLRTNYLKEVGLFNNDMFMYSEDLDLGWRFWLADYQCYYCPISTIYHKYQFCKSISQIYFMERNRFICLFTNYQIKTLFWLLPALFIMEIGQLFYSLKRKWFWQKLKSYYYFTDPHVLLKIKHNRQIIKKIRKRSDGFLLRMFAGKISFQEIDNPVLNYIANPLFHTYLNYLRKIIS